MRLMLSLLLSLLAVAPALAAPTSARKYLDKPDDWFRTAEAKTVADEILSWQADDGGWPKNVDTAARLYDKDRSKLHSTFDNGATTDELRFLARVFDATHSKRYSDAFNCGLTLILKAQYPNGGWPQSYPPPKDYERYITYNDGAMGRLMFFLREVARDDKYAFVPADQRTAAAKAWDKGVECILNTQVKVDGKLTAWCAQHDEKTLAPAAARTFELVSLSGCESVGLVHVLMAIDNPSPRVIAAVESAIAWFKSAAIPGIRTDDIKDSAKPKGFTRVVVKDPSAPPMWARFYEIGTNKPIFSDRDGVKKYSLAEIGDERRNGYRWLSYWGKDLIEKDYPAWKNRVASASLNRAGTQSAWKEPPASQAAATRPAGVCLRIVLVGDSTVTNTAGWGAGFARLLKDDVDCINTSRGGRSTRSFRAEGRWNEALALNGEYILIQFGHNDQKLDDPNRGADAEKAYPDFLRQYVDEARAAGAKPILVTPLTRRQFDKSGKINSGLIPWVNAMKAVAAEKNCLIIDLHSRSIELCEKLGPAAFKELAPMKDNGQLDGTHLNEKGADLFAPLVRDELIRVVPELAGCFKGTPAK